MGAEGQAALRERPGADLLLLEEFDVQEARLGLMGDLGKTAHAAYALELCDRLCRPTRRAGGVRLAPRIPAALGSRAGQRRTPACVRAWAPRSLGARPSARPLFRMWSHRSGRREYALAPRAGRGGVWVLCSAGRPSGRNNTPGARPSVPDGVGRRRDSVPGPRDQCTMPTSYPWAAAHAHRRAFAFIGFHREDGWGY